MDVWYLARVWLGIKKKTKQITSINKSAAKRSSILLWFIIGERVRRANQFIAKCYNAKNTSPFLMVIPLCLRHSYKYNFCTMIYNKE